MRSKTARNHFLLSRLETLKRLCFSRSTRALLNTHLPLLSCEDLFQDLSLSILEEEKRKKKWTRLDMRRKMVDLLRFHSCPLRYSNRTIQVEGEDVEFLLPPVLPNQERELLKREIWTLALFHLSPLHLSALSLSLLSLTPREVGQALGISTDRVLCLLRELVHTLSFYALSPRTSRRRELAEWQRKRIEAGRILHSPLGPSSLPLRARNREKRKRKRGGD